MKSKILVTAACFLAITLLITGCEKKTMERLAPEQTDFSNSSMVQFYNGIVGSNRTFVYVDNVPVTGIPVAFGTSFPLATVTSASSTSATPYSFIIPAGTHAFSIRDTAAATTQSPLAFSSQFQPNTNYTIFGYDTSIAAKQVVVQTTIEHPTDGTARIRFGNLIYSGTPVPAVDIYSAKANATIFSNISSNQVSDFIAYTPAPRDTLQVRETGTANILAQFNAFNALQAKSYTFVFRGRYQSTSGTSQRTLSIFTNY